MLALMGVAAAGSRGGGTLVFDEVDAGIGGQTARAVGDQLREPAAERQVICITHLPQVACLADAHFRISKRVAGGETIASVERLAGEDLVAEVCRMLGADVADTAASRHARELLAAA
jgi:DNA repair protein RecN (Recombination protein N)